MAGVSARIGTDWASVSGLIKSKGVGWLSFVVLQCMLPQCMLPQCMLPQCMYNACWRLWWRVSGVVASCWRWRVHRQVPTLENFFALRAGARSVACPCTTCQCAAYPCAACPCAAYPCAACAVLLVVFALCYAPCVVHLVLCALCRETLCCAPCAYPVRCSMYYAHCAVPPCTILLVICCLCLCCAPCACVLSTVADAAWIIFYRYLPPPPAPRFSL